MRKSLLLVGAFLTVAAMAQAKEVVPEPISRCIFNSSCYGSSKRSCARTSCS